MGARFLAWSPYGQKLGYRVTDIEAGLNRMLAAGGVCFVAEREDRIIGAIVGILSELWFRPGVPVATELAWWVDPDARGATGIRLLRRFETWAIEKGAGLIALSDLVVDGVEPADKLFRSLGFTTVERSHIKEF